MHSCDEQSEATAQERHAFCTPDTVTARGTGEFAVLRAVMQSSTVARWRTMKNDWEEPLQFRKLDEDPGRSRGTALFRVEHQFVCN